MSVTFPKRYFSALEASDNIIVHVFENFMLLSGDNSNLMILFEMSA
jgi:hypothetical protein